MENWRYSPSKDFENSSLHKEEHEDVLPDHQEDVHGIEIQKVPEDALAKEAIKKNPKAIFEHVVAAAQRKEAIERLYELRQEVKDESATTNAAGEQTAVPVGTILADAASRQPGLAQVPAPPPPPSQMAQPALPPEPNESGPSIYRRAVITGFVTALFLVVGFGILLFLRR